MTDNPGAHKVLILDIETAPLLAYVWGSREDYIPHDRMIHDSFLLCWAAKWEGQTSVQSACLTTQEALDQDDGRVVEGLAKMIRQADVIVAHNIDRFDLPMLNNRLLQLKLQPLGPVRTIDTLRLAQKSFRLAHNKLDYLATVLGIDNKMDTDFDLWKACYHGDQRALKKMQKYNRKDVVILEQVLQALKPYVKNFPRLMDASFEGEMSCPFCGEGNLMKRGFHRTNASTFQRWHCQDCGRYSRSRTAEKKHKLATVPL